MTERPLSPHLSVYRMYRYSLLSSITNRITGLVLSAGLILLVYWLVAVASGPAAYRSARQVLSLGVLKAVYVLLLAAFSYHLIAGIRHLVWDTGHGLERSQSQRSAWLVGIASMLLLIGLAWWALHAGGNAP
ncbi:MAG TPA: succinate dehydrogenase, cytochrome b556 subunit [Steroidobacteraceae bacterium]|nr:succinate dehydrogenase, cytochrome b556 subunit [Steroidobacteraceae bacterium]